MTRFEVIQVLGTRSRKLLQLVEHEIKQQGGRAQIWDDALGKIGSRMRVVRPALAELVALGLIEHTRGRKYSTFTLSERWREISDVQAAIRIAGVARESRTPLRAIGHVEARVD